MRTDAALLAGAFAIAALHPVVLDLATGRRLAAGSAAGASWLAQVADPFVLAVHPASWPLVAGAGLALLPPVAATAVLLLAAWGTCTTRLPLPWRGAWGGALAASSLAAATTSTGMQRAWLGAAVALAVAAAAASAVRMLGSVSRRAPATVAGLAICALFAGMTSFRVLPSWRASPDLAAAAVAAAPGSAAAHLAHARSLAKRGDADGELSALQRALALAPRDVGVRLALGRAYASRASWNEAERHLVEVARHFRDRAVPSLEAADAAARAGHGLRARRLVAHAAAVDDPAAPLDGVSEPVLVELARRLLDQDAPDRAAQVYAALRRSGRNPGLAREHARALFAAGRQGEAGAALRDALAADPRDADSAIELAWMLATGPASTDRAATDEALRWARAATELRASDPAALDALAAAQAAAGDFAAATESATRALDLGRALGDAGWVSSVQRRLEGYRDGRPYRAPL